MSESDALSDSELEVWRAFYVMRRRLDRALDLQFQRDSGISASEYEVLFTLNDAPNRQLRSRDIAAGIGWEKSRVSHLVSRMEKRGLVARAECEMDLRGSWIGLTPDGRRAVLRAIRGHLAAVRRYFFDALEPGDAERLLRLSGRVVDAIGCAADEDSPSGDATLHGDAA
ncbi:MarR family winged helix-turn-helix transcriptional regulator [Lacisediminihabitans sp.]|uniref:MarR family winged helix-turn-helix transcriptional regulator n=1 Tax=Lacisediminihabitans sp. TaxID=2787631 RepID=UPI00374D241A